MLFVSNISIPAQNYHRQGGLLVGFRDNRGGLWCQTCRIIIHFDEPDSEKARATPSALLEIRNSSIHVDVFHAYSKFFTNQTIVF